MPKVVVVTCTEDNTIKLTKEEFENYLNEAYTDGYNEGYTKKSNESISLWNTYPHLSTNAYATSKEINE